MPTSPTERNARELARDHGVLTVPEAAARLTCSTQTLRRRMAQGLLPFYQVDDHGTRLLDAADVDALLRGRRGAA
ncbi:helix-turn-helix domain-containing protein [Oryzobacter terrae]|uniref:helix-turn-helix domain-containing protein n=1 Tax=Oryzobacter terrae TaxID=1620385 RepID=UPI00366BC0FC